MADHFAEGFETRQGGLPREANPYPQDDGPGHQGGPWRDWDEGWESADDELRISTPSRSATRCASRADAKAMSSKSSALFASAA